MVKRSMDVATLYLEHFSHSGGNRELISEDDRSDEFLQTSHWP